MTTEGGGGGGCGSREMEGGEGERVGRRGAGMWRSLRCGHLYLLALDTAPLGMREGRGGGRDGEWMEEKVRITRERER